MILPICRECAAPRAGSVLLGQRGSFPVNGFRTWDCHRIRPRSARIFNPRVGDAFPAERTAAIERDRLRHTQDWNSDAFTDATPCPV